MAESSEPIFKLVTKDGDFEIRDYEPVAAAEMTFGGDRDTAVRAGFELLFGYISGDNETKQKIAMTSPVTQSKLPVVTSATTDNASSDDNNVWAVRFMMPNRATSTTLPKPGDRRIAILDLPARRTAVLRFSGLWTDGNLTENRDKLAALIKAKGLQPLGEPLYAFYDPPWQPFFWRRNEIIWDIAPN